MKRLLHVFLMGQRKQFRTDVSFFSRRYSVVWFCGVNEIKREKITLLYFFFFIHFVILYFKITMSGVQNVITHNNRYFHER